MSGAERKHLPASLRRNSGRATSEALRYVEFNDHRHDETLLAYHSQPHLQRTESQRWSLLRSDLQTAHDLVHMTFLLLSRNLRSVQPLAWALNWSSCVPFNERIIDRIVFSHSPTWREIANSWEGDSSPLLSRKLRSRGLLRRVTENSNHFCEVELRRASTRTGEHRSTSDPVLTWRERQQWSRATAKAICLRVSPVTSQFFTL